ncbi:MAG: hypothetical protein ABF379_05310 [Akkermansiaceae bacterium]
MRIEQLWVLSEEEFTALSTPLDPPAKPDLVIDTVSVAETSMAITWAAEGGELFEVWRPPDLILWGEVDDNVEARAEGGSNTLEFGETRPDRVFFHVQKWE